MDAALGAPAKMAEREDDLTPMMSQYFELCRRYDDCLVLFQVGDFYEAFCEAAEAVSRLLEVTLTKREDSTGEYAMAGVPVDDAESYVDTLLDAGYRVAIADQVQDPDEVTGVVDRAVTRVVTPGTLTEDELLDTAANNYVACLASGRGCEGSRRGADAVGGAERERYGLAVLDVSTGDFYATTADGVAAVRNEVERFGPSEAVIAPEVEVAEAVFDAGCTVTSYEAGAFDPDAAGERVASYFGSPETLLAGEAEVRACGALLAYAEFARGGAGIDADRDGATDGDTEDCESPGRLSYLNHLTRYDPREYMLLDAVALRSLEVFDRRSVHGSEGTALVDVVDETACAMGSRRLKDWLRRPLLDEERIRERLEAIDEFSRRVQTREAVADRLREVYDLERLVSRAARGRADARDLRSLKDSLDAVPAMREHLDGAEAALLAEIREDLDEMADVRDLVDRAIREDPPAEITEGGVVDPGYSDELAELRSTEREGKAWIDDLAEHERERTGIDSLKVGYNSVHGYYVEVTKPNVDRVPEEYTRRQTLKNAERYYTPELKRREDEILRAEQRADDLEHRLFREVRDAVAAEAERVQALADRLAALDVLVAFAEVAATRDYCRPTVGAEDLAIRSGRHPVVERTEESFVPNDVRLDDEGSLAVLTGPNMSGKSTYMRQVALVQVLAQAGSFVPAADATLPVVDRVFTRVGASDDIAGGRSTFMIEMVELAEILEHATADSLVLLDEVGRGTSTADGLAIARAITEYVHDEVGATTLFATHHHELTAVADRLPRAFNLHFRASQDGGDVTFEHEVARGAATASYGVEVAATAGVPDPVVERSRELLEGDVPAGDPSENPASATAGTGPDRRGRLDGSQDAGADAPVGGATGNGNEETVPAVVEALRRANVASMTPLEALNELDRLQRLVDAED